MRRSILFLVLLPLILVSSMTHADTEARGMVRIKDAQGQQVGLYKNSYALLIGVSDYTAG